MSTQEAINMELPMLRRAGVKWNINSYPSLPWIRFTLFYLVINTLRED